MDRRKFLKIMGAAGVMGALPLKFGLRGAGLNQAWAVANSPGLTKFHPDSRLPTLPILPHNSGDPLIQMAFPIDDPFFSKTKYYQVAISEFTQQLHPELPNPTHLWGYRDVNQAIGTQTHIGGLIVTNEKQPVRIRFTNELPATHILPVDPTLPGADAGAAENRTAVHLHGGLIPWTSDGGPFDWWAPDGSSGASFLNGPGGFLDQLYPAGQKMVAGQADYLYPNQQSYRLMWYHDHALGITRLNAYAGIATGYYLRDSVVDHLEKTGMIPPLSRLIPLVFQDKTFIPSTGNPDAGGRGGPGDLWYPSLYDGPDPNTAPIPSCVPEFFGDTMLVNGVVYPFVEVEQRKYRFMALNACNARFLRLKLVAEDPNNPGEPLGGYDTPTVGPAFVQYATEGGFLSAPVTFTGNTDLDTLLLAPAERAEWTVDFSNVSSGVSFLLYNDASAPFPSGDPGNDYYPGNPDNLIQPDPGKGPNTRTIMKIVVKARVGAADRERPLRLPAISKSLLNKAKKLTPVDLTLNEGFDGFGRLIQMVGGNTDQGGNFYGIPYLASADLPGAVQIVKAGETQVWRIFNLTGDTHPMHIHLVNWRIISRTQFAPDFFPTILDGPPQPPDPNEQGWKETVRMAPGEYITVVAKFDLPDMKVYRHNPNGKLTGGKPVVQIPESPRLKAMDISNANEYVWHCHILEHEEHDMMHALVVV